VSVVEAHDVVVELGAFELELVKRKTAAMVDTFKTELRANGYGESNFRADRDSTIDEDNLVGQVATLAGCKWLYGTALGHYVWRSSRWAADRAPTVGDGGADVPGSNIDFKGSLLRNADRPLDAYHLPVRPRERHAGNVYVCVLVERAMLRSHLVGWATDEQLPADAETDGVFKGAHVLGVSELNPCPPFGWTL